MKDDRFEWDDGKARRNLRKHGVSFDEARAVFDDANALVEWDDSDTSEERWATIGLSLGRVLYVVSTERRESVIRIISARRATRHEEDRYYRQAFP
jgi:uncharacterized DUF497 family protein